ncbi:MAG: OadG family protein [Saprospiraceae bacterium]|nr:OadG family protein [Saprospiraceae bacterium]
MILNLIKFDLSSITSNELMVAAVGYVIVFFALVLLVFVFSNIPKLLNISIRKRLRKQGKIIDSESEDFSITGDVNAAISMALYLYFSELHDDESNVLTIKKVSKVYSPWSSKIYGLNSYKR